MIIVSESILHCDAAVAADGDIDFAMDVGLFNLFADIGGRFGGDGAAFGLEGVLGDAAVGGKASAVAAGCDGGSGTIEDRCGICGRECAA